MRSSASGWLEARTLLEEASCPGWVCLVLHGCPMSGVSAYQGEYSQEIVFFFRFLNLGLGTPKEDPEALPDLLCDNSLLLGHMIIESLLIIEGYLYFGFNRCKVALCFFLWKFRI